jgi:hypothetical protein
MHGPINVKSPNNISKWQMGFNSAFKGLRKLLYHSEGLANRYVPARREGAGTKILALYGTDVLLGMRQSDFDVFL